jgi:uncharacterized protein
MKKRRLPKFTRIIRIMLFILISIVLVGYIAGSIFLTNLFTTIPSRGKLASGSPASFDLAFEEVAFTSTAKDKITLRGWWIPKANSNRAILLAHGKDSDRVQLLSIGKVLWEQGYNILVFDARGHGLSGGERITYGKLEKQDISGAINFMKSRGAQIIGALGWSMGASSILNAMGEINEIKAAVLDSPYGDFNRLAQARLGFLIFFYPGMLLSCSLLCAENLADVRPESSFANMGSRKILLMHGDKDGTVPISEAYAIEKVGGQNIAEAWLLEGVGHNDAYFRYPNEYLDKVITFFQKELG